MKNLKLRYVFSWHFNPTRVKIKKKMYRVDSEIIRRDNITALIIISMFLILFGINYFMAINDLINTIIAFSLIILFFIIRALILPKDIEKYLIEI